MLPQTEHGKFRPPSDVVATEEKFVVRVEIAAMQTDDFRLSLLNRKLVVSGNRQLRDIDQSTTFHQVEIETGEFRLEFALPKPVDEKQVVADYQNGILQIDLPYLSKRSVRVISADQVEKD